MYLDSSYTPTSSITNESSEDNSFLSFNWFEGMYIYIVAAIALVVVLIIIFTCCWCVRRKEHAKAKDVLMNSDTEVQLLSLSWLLLKGCLNDMLWLGGLIIDESPSGISKSDYR
jgi:Na+/H+ antiporter NhaD/arsenite permease-like protein